MHIYHFALQTNECLILATLLALAAATIQVVHAAEPLPQKHVVLIIWDGMRPDFIRDDLTPNLSKLARRGVNFTNHHSVFPTSTEVNGAALATGTAPNINGIVGNREYRPSIDATHPIDTQDAVSIVKSDELTGGLHLAVATLPELARLGGLKTAVAGTKPVARLFDRKPDAVNRGDCVMLAEGKTIPDLALEHIVATCGEFPKAAATKGPLDHWTTNALCDVLWRRGVPVVSVLWLSEPDYSQHTTGPGSATSLEAIKSSDDCLGRVIDALKRDIAFDSTDVLVVSDHGFSTIEHLLSIDGEVNNLKRAGFDAAETRRQAQTSGQILIVDNGGYVGYYVGNHDQTTIRRLVGHLKTTDFAGVIFVRTALPGTFSLEQGAINTPDAPDVVVSMRWTNQRSASGTPGLLVWCDGGQGAGDGHHGSLSQFDTHNTLIAAGPDFKSGIESPYPSSNIDVTPTLCAILGIALPPDKLAWGRVLNEALVGRELPKSTPVTTIIRALDDDGSWQQYLKTTEFEGHTYLDEGGRIAPAKPAP
jgi:arylsulfatase A-like enzyme